MQYTLHFNPPDSAPQRVGRQVYEADRIENVPTEVIDAILADIHKRSPKFKVYYTRRWEDHDGVIWFDYGSYTSFYTLVPVAPQIR